MAHILPIILTSDR